MSRISDSQGNEAKINPDGSLRTSLIGSLPNIIKAGKTNATTVDQSITGDFNSVSLVNDGPNELIIAIDQSTSTATSLFYIAPGEPFERNIKGTSMHYSVASGSATLRYDLV